MDAKTNATGRITPWNKGKIRTRRAFEEANARLGVESRQA
jgi:hypothetical protein